MKIQPIAISKGYSYNKSNSKQSNQNADLKSNHSQPAFGMKKVGSLKTKVFAFVMTVLSVLPQCKSGTEKGLNEIYLKNCPLSGVIYKIEPKIKNEITTIGLAMKRKKPKKLKYDDNSYKYFKLENELLVNKLDSAAKANNPNMSSKDLEKFKTKVYGDFGLDYSEIRGDYEYSNTPSKTFNKKATALFAEYQ